jgi:hypothetical protein
MSSASLDPSYQDDLAADLREIIVRISGKIRRGDENAFLFLLLGLVQAAV